MTDLKTLRAWKRRAMKIADLSRELQADMQGLGLCDLDAAISAERAKLIASRPRGFQAMTAERRAEISRMGGEATANRKKTLTAANNGVG